MNWLIFRIGAGLLAMLTGALLGHWLGRAVIPPPWAELAGGALGIALAVLLDTLRGYRLMAWLRGGETTQTPRGGGLWGELGYRIARSLHQREQDLARERLRLTQFLRAIEASPNGVLLLDAQDQIDWCNSAAADHFTLDPQRDHRQRIANLVRAPAFVTALQQGRFDETVTFPKPGGGATLSVLLRRYGEGMKLVLSQDITDHERQEAMRRDFVANVSHEIRSPLTVLAGFVETFASLPLSEAERARVLTLMGEQTRRMQALVSDLLTLAQLEGSPRPAADHWVALDAALARIETEARSLSQGRHRISVACPAGVQLAAASAELHSAIANLVNNAVRYTPEGGCIEVDWRLLADGAGELSVSDSGIGIASEHLPRLTERFYRVDSSRSRDSGGTGLGLAIVKHVAQRHGAELDVHSEPGKGTRFRLLFPALRVRAQPAAAE
ncbi:MAG: phosphate regulon sensor histidine kinase PhoR [Zoogloeaceae bacterium]|jgi:two-component system phosphate regulon sensor histidine kinase PhoR|nr:phosphate regulon sensor histidine kinase PhoR [Zoogloeaceae bacterium]